MLELEALRAKKGDALLLHHGDGELMVVDGGPAGVWKQSLKPRLEELRADTGHDQLAIGMVMVSHIDDDHINGLLQMTDGLVELHDDKQRLNYDVQRLWHNAFDDVLGEPGSAVARPVDGDVDTASVDAVAADLDVSEPTALILASVAQGQRLRNNADKLGLKVNSGFGQHRKLVQAGVRGPVELGDLKLTVIGPRAAQLAEFQKEWDKEVKKQQDKAKTAQYVDDSAPNLASIVVLVQSGDTKLLLTGDARGDHTLAGAREVGILGPEPDAKLAVDVLKLPHHGSFNNVERDFFDAFPAVHYVISGDGSHGNPNVETFEMLLESRRGDKEEFDLWLTYDPADYKDFHGEKYPLKKLLDLLDEHGRGSRFQVHFPAAGDLGVVLDLD